MPRSSTPKDRYFWRNYSDEKLLQLRICELNLQLQRTRLVPWLKQIEAELKAKGFRFRPHYWLSEEFFSPDGIPGIALPFYLAHPRLERLEKKQMFEAEGNNRRWFLKIVRHELGHAIEHAYRLNRRKERQKLFGKSSQKYPDYYSPRPYSRSYVVHLENWYAQAHPDEDFAETFAVWFSPHSAWRRRYKGWPALKKLQYMDELMEEIRNKTPSVKSKAKIEPLRQNTKTLAEYYEEKKERFGLDADDNFYDRELKKLFSSEAAFAKNLKASRFIRKHRKEMRSTLAFWTGQYRYNLNELLDELIDRCEELELRLTQDEDKTKSDLLVFLSVQTMNYIHNGGYQLAI